MARINLLPWREEARRERQRQFLYSLMATLVLGAILVLIIGLFFDQRISHQEARNITTIEAHPRNQRVARSESFDNVGGSQDSRGRVETLEKVRA